MTNAVKILREVGDARRTGGASAAKKLLEATVGREVEKVRANGGRRRRGPRRKKSVMLSPRAPASDSADGSVTTDSREVTVSASEMIRDARAALSRVVQALGPLTIPAHAERKALTLGELHDWNEHFDSFHMPIVTALDRLVDYSGTLRSLQRAVGQLENGR